MHWLAYSAFLLFLFSHASKSEVKYFENGEQTRRGPDAGMFVDTPLRKKIDLSGPWRCTSDGKQWKTVSVPGAYDWVGEVTFRRTFEITEEMLDNFVFSVVAYGINYQSEIIINGNFVGRHIGGYSSFVFPIAPNVLQVGGENTITIIVDNELTPKTTLPLRQDVSGWRSYGGIFRDIYLLATPKLFIGQVVVKTLLSDDRTNGSVKVTAEITDQGFAGRDVAGASLGFLIELYDKLTGELRGTSPSVPFTLLPNKTTEVNTQVVVLNPKLWSPDVPDLYVVKCKIVKSLAQTKTTLDEYIVDVGFRELKWKNRRLYVNDSLTVLNGVVWFEDHPSFGSAMTYEAMERDIAMIKTLGANLVRFPYPPHPYMLNLCDRYGLLVMEEIPLVRVPSEILREVYYQDLAIAYLKEMVLRDRHHVCVLGWGIGDEFQMASPDVCDYVKTARNTVRSLDERMVYLATKNYNGFCSGNIDILALNSYGMDAKSFRQILEIAKDKSSQPLIVGRYGISIEPGNRRGYSDPYSMEAQARYIMQMREVISELKVAGGIVFSFNDWRSDRPALTTPAKDVYLRTMGIVSYEREKRTSFDVVRALYNKEKVQALPVGNYIARTPVVYVMAGLVILIAFAFLYNRSRRFRECVNRSLFRTYNFFADVRDQRILAYPHTIFLIAVLSVMWATILSSVFSYYRSSLLFDNLLSQFMADGVKEWFIGLVNDPMRFILIFSALIALKIFFLTLIVQLFSFMVKSHVYFYHAFSITVWSLLPCVVLIPVAMVLYRLMDTELYVLIFVGLAALVMLLVLIRLFKGISIIYDVYPIRVYAGGLLFLTIIAVAIYGYFDFTQSAPLYVKYLLQTVHSSM